MTDLSPLFSPFARKLLRLANRFAMAPLIQPFEATSLATLR